VIVRHAQQPPPQPMQHSPEGNDSESISDPIDRPASVPTSPMQVFSHTITQNTISSSHPHFCMFFVEQFRTIAQSYEFILMFCSDHRPITKTIILLPNP
jgi:hypothetical protein